MKALLYHRARYAGDRARGGWGCAAVDPGGVHRGRACAAARVVERCPVSLFRRGRPEERASGAWPQLIPSRLAPSGSLVSPDTAPGVVAFGAAVNLQASIVSMLPVDCFTGFGADQRPIAKPPLLLDPGGQGYGWSDWLYQAMISGGYRGNIVGRIDARDGRGRRRWCGLSTWQTYRSAGMPAMARPVEDWHRRRGPGEHLASSPLPEAGSCPVRVTHRAVRDDAGTRAVVGRVRFAMVRRRGAPVRNPHHRPERPARCRRRDQEALH